MKVVLLVDVKKMGKKYDVIDVSSGHATNFLIPQKKAVQATGGKIKWAEEQKKNTVTEREIQANLLEKNVEDIKSAVVKMSGKVNEKGHLFAGIHKEELLKELTAQTGLSLDPDFIVLEKPVKEIGEFDIVVKSGKVETKFKLIVSAE